MKVLAATLSVTFLVGVALVLLVVDAWNHMPTGSVASSPAWLIGTLFLGAAIFGLLGSLCSQQFDRCQIAMGLRRRRFWTDPFIPALLAIPVFAIFSVGRTLTYTSLLNWRLYDEIATIEGFSFLLLIGCELIVAILIGRRFHDLVVILNSIDRDWWRR
jgi:hypothetical protein